MIASTSSSGDHMRLKYINMPKDNQRVEEVYRDILSYLSYQWLPRKFIWIFNGEFWYFMQQSKPASNEQSLIRFKQHFVNSRTTLENLEKLWTGSCMFLENHRCRIRMRHSLYAKRCNIVDIFSISKRWNMPHIYGQARAPFTLTWINFNPNMDKYPHAHGSLGWNHLSIPKLQRHIRWSLGMDE